MKLILKKTKHTWKVNSDISHPIDKNELRKVIKVLLEVYEPWSENIIDYGKKMYDLGVRFK